MKTLSDLITVSGRRFGPRAAMTLAREGNSENWTYGDLYRYARRVAQLLQMQGIAPGDRVIIWAPNGPRWVGSFFGCVLAGVVVVPLDVKSSAEFVGKIAAQTEPRLLITTQSSASSPDLPPIPCQAVEDLDAALPEDDPDWTPHAVQPDDMAELVFTSGTTGAPKGVMLSHGNILSDLEAAKKELGDLEAIYKIHTSTRIFRMLSLLPLSHMFEQIAEMFYVLSIGAAITYVDSLQPSTIFKAMREGAVTGIPVVPQVLGLFMTGLEREVRKQGKWTSWERGQRIAPYLPIFLRRLLFRDIHARLGGRLDFFICGGAYLDPALAQKWENLGIKVVTGYGMTETSPIVAMNSLARRNLNSVGKVLSCNEVRIASDGEILVRGSNVTRGYWRNEEATADAFEDGWYKTGDFGQLDAEGYLYFKGRKKNLIVLSNGMNVYPEDIENALTQQDGVNDAVVVGREVNNDVELHALLLLGHTADPEAIVKNVNRKLAAHQRLKGYFVWPERDFPRTHTLKPKRDEMLRTFEAARLRCASSRISR
ncbi:MAG TPA: AMP-binding protein [Chloroflexota bacterium]|nr:AMP-binding protein [Chloroflexota bacterium]